MNEQNSFGRRLRDLRKSRSIKAKDLAKVLFCSPSLIYNIEKAYSEPQPDFIVRAATFFNVTTDFLLGVEEQRVLPSGEELVEFYKRLSLESKMVIFSLLRLLAKS